jgi:hypothetical protein
MDVMYVEDLDKMPCAVEGCPHNGEHAVEYGPMILHAKCHPTSPTWTMYHDQVMIVVCAECNTEVAQIAVASIKDGE